MALERFAHVATCLSLTHADFADCNDDNDKDNDDSESDNVRPARPYPMAQLHKWRSHKRDELTMLLGYYSMSVPSQAPCGEH